MNQPIIISLEGNIAAGKTTLLAALEKITNGHILTVAEKVDEWRFMGQNRDINCLDLVYRDPSRYYFVFQMNVQNSRYRCISNAVRQAKANVQKGDSNALRIILTERDIRTAPMIFGKHAFKEGYLEKIHLEVLIDTVNVLHQKYEAKLLIYMRTSVDECFNRKNKRDRKEERDAVTYDLLQKLHDLHEKFFKSALAANEGQIVYDHDHRCHMVFFNYMNTQPTDIEKLAVVIKKLCSEYEKMSTTENRNGLLNISDGNEKNAICNLSI